MQSSEFSDEEFFRTLATSGARALVIGRRALILLGAPVMTADYDLWLHIDDIEKLNRAFEERDHVPNWSPAEARQRGRYVLENGERVDVIVARRKDAGDLQSLEFDAAWSRRRAIEIGAEIQVFVPNLDDLITTKRWGTRPKDLLDIQFLESLRRRGK